MNTMLQGFFLGFVKIHILHHAAQKPVFGSWVIEELARHGYRLSPGTLYPILHSLEKGGQLKSHEEVVQGKRRKYYRATAKGRSTLGETRMKIRELLNELTDDSTTKNPR